MTKWLLLACWLTASCLAGTLDRHKRQTFACEDDETEIITPHLFKPTTTHSCATLFGMMDDFYNNDYRSQCQLWQGLDSLPQQIMKFQVDTCKDFSNGTTRYRAKVCCEGPTATDPTTAPLRCFACSNYGYAGDSTEGYNTEQCNYEGGTVECAQGEVCMTTATYSSSALSYGTYSKQCAVRTDCETKANDGKCRSGISDPSCTYCCDTPYCNFDHPMSELTTATSTACSAKPCKHGTCTNDDSAPNGYTCECFGYASGDTCKTTKCSTRPCAHRGYCTNSLEAPYFKCACTAKWCGNDCKQACQLCDSSFCQNGGTCYDRGSVQRCICTRDFVGSQCEIARPIPCMDTHLKQLGEQNKKSVSHNCTSYLHQTELTKHTSKKYITKCAELMSAAYSNTKFVNGRNGQVDENDRISLYKCQKGDDTLFFTYDVCCASCLSNPCQNGGWCQPTEGNNYMCKCPFGYGGQNCEHKLAVCYGCGDPHYVSFDKSLNNFQGSCKYKLTVPQNGAGLNDFKVLVKNENRYGMTTVTYISYIELVLGDISIKVDKTKAITINGVRATPGTTFRGGKVGLNGRFIHIETDFGLAVESDGDWVVIVKVPDQYKNKVQGLCGNLDDVKENDFTGGDGTDFKDDPNKHSMFGTSWKVSDPSDPTCFSPTVDPKTCDATLLDAVSSNTYCGMLKDTAFDNPFYACIQNDQANAATFYDSCVYDVCANQDGDMAFVACKSLEAFAVSCHDAGHPSDWRQVAQCPLDCPVGSTYQRTTSACPATCANPNAPHECGLPDTEACVCDDGMMMESGRCIVEEDCGCMDDTNNRFEFGDIWSSADCATKYTCTRCETCESGFEIESVADACGQGFICGLNDDGRYGCKQNDCVDDNGAVRLYGSSWLSSDCATSYSCTGTISPTSVAPCSGGEQCAMTSNTGYQCVANSCMDADGNRFQFGDRWMSSDCSLWRVCETGGAITDTAAGCSVTEYCQQRICVEKTCVDEMGGTRHLSAKWTSANCMLELTCTNAGITETNTLGCSTTETCQASGDLAECVGLASSWSTWSGWGQCSELCGKGHQQRSRVCQPAGGQCPGEALETRLCQCINNFSPSDCDHCKTADNVLGYLPDPCDCSSYYQCKNNPGGWIAYHMTCGPCTHWNQAKVTCDHAPGPCDAGSNNGYGSDGGGTNDMCDGDNVQKKRHATDDHKYMWLVHGRWMVWDCPAGTLFSTEKCDCTSSPDYYAPRVSTPVEITCFEFTSNALGSQYVWAQAKDTVISGGEARFRGYGKIEIPLFNNRYDYKAFSVSMWFRRNGYSTGSQGLLYNGDCDTSASVAIMSESPDTVGAAIKTQHGDASITGIPVVYDSWHHVVLVYNGVRLMLYVDGQPYSSQSVTGKIQQRYCPLILGSARRGEGFTGSMDKVCIYRSALTAGDVQGFYTAGHV